MQGRRTSWIAAAVAALAVMGAPEAAGAATGQIAGNPLIVYADGLGQLQIRYSDQAEGVFYGDDEDVANAGLELRVGELAYPLGSSERSAVSGPELAIVAPGKRALRSVWRAGDLRVAEEVNYTDGTESVRLHYVITNAGSAPVSFAAGELADLYGAGDDQGRGILQAGPPRFVGGLSDNGALTGLVETTPWAHYQSGYYSAVFSDFRAGGLTDVIDPELVDNGAGAEWRFDAVAPGATRTIDVDWRVGAATVDRRVNTTADHVPDDLPDPCAAPSDCTLREALQSSPTGSVIELPAGTYELERGELYVGAVTMRGAGAGATTISGAGRGRVLYVSSRASLSGVRVTGGTGAGESASGSGGGIYVGVESELTLMDVAITGNAAPGSGGGIYSRGMLTVMRSVIAGNEAALGGGGIAVEGGRARLVNSTVDANRAAAGGGVQSSGGHVVELLNVTLSANTGGGLYINLPTRAFASAARADENVSVVNTILAGNAGGACGGDTPGVSGHSLSDDATCALAGPGDRQGADARLAPLRADGVRPLTEDSPAVDAGDDQACPSGDQVGTARPQRARCDVGAYELPAVATPPPPQATATPTPTPAPTATPAPPVDTLQLPPPVAGKTVNAVTKSGTVLIKLRGKRTFVALGPGQQIPVGTEIDTRKGRITLTAAADKRGGTQTADFYSGIFKLSQTGGSKPTTVLALTEKLSCPKGKRASAAAAKKKSRKLWGDGKGKFRTKGQFSSATVRGTVWLTEDRCDRTLTRVTSGAVAVRDFAKRRTVLVKAGRSYVAREKRR